MTFKIKILKTPNDSDLKAILNLYIQEQWWDGSPDENLVLEIIKGSHIFVAAFDNQKLIGMGRAISDGVSDAYIQDVTMDKSYRKKGIGSLIINKIIEELKKRKIYWIGLISEKNSDQFYEKIGFDKMNNSYPMKYKI